MKGWELEWKTKFSWALEGWSCAIGPSNFIALYSILDSINRSFMLMQSIKPATEKAMVFREVTGQNLTPKKNFKNIYRGYAFQSDTQDGEEFLAWSMSMNVFCAEVQLVMSVKWYICSARGCSMRLIKLYNFRDSHLLYCLYVFLSSVIFWHLEALGLKKFLTKGTNVESEMLALATGIPIVTTTTSEYFSLQLRVCASSLRIHTGVSWGDATLAKSWKVESTRVARASLALIKSPIAQLLSSSVGSNSAEAPVMRRNAPETTSMRTLQRHLLLLDMISESLQISDFSFCAASLNHLRRTCLRCFHRLPSCLKTHWQNNGDTGREFEFDVGECEVWLLRNWIVKPREVFTELSKSHWFKRLDEIARRCVIV